MRLAPWSTLLGLALMAAILVTTFFTEAFRMTLVFGVPFLALLSALYLVFVRKPGRDCPIERATPRRSPPCEPGAHGEARPARPFRTGRFRFPYLFRRTKALPAGRRDSVA